jgi:hypothetical protein
LIPVRRIGHAPQRESVSTPGPVWRAVLAVLLAVAMSGLPRVGAATTERVVSDRFSGLAINGMDPVAYFTDREPLYGRPDQEYRYRGVIWRFCNEGNKAAFMAHPEVYMPRYGGYDPIAVGRAVAVPGNPLVWALVRERLYLFYNEEARARFIAKPDEAILRADNKWPTVINGLVP